MLGARRPQVGQSKASATTLCQNYECTVAPSERPYNARPSRTQQLANPKLKPRLTNDSPAAPSDLLQKSGAADATLARRDAERRAARGPRASRSRPASPRAAGRKPTTKDRLSHSPSSSSSRSRSVSTISTNLSRSPSPARRMQDVTYPSHTGYGSQRDIAYPSQLDSQTMSGITGGLEAVHPIAPASSGSRKRRRGSSTSSGGSAASSRSRSVSSHDSMSHDGKDRKSKRDDDGSNMKRNTRRRRQSVSPEARGRRRRHSKDVYGRRHRSKSRNRSRDRSNIARHRQSMTPEVESRVRGFRGGPQAAKNGIDRPNRDYGHGGRRDDALGARVGRAQPPPPRQKSLSPFSKRRAMTQAMNQGRL